MKCKDIEKLIIESSGEFSSLEERERILSHIQHCSRCSRLQEDLGNLRGLLNRGCEPDLPEDLDKKTYLKCLSEIYSLQNDKKKESLQKQLQSIPLYMKVVFISLLALTIFWIFPFFEDFGFADENLSFSTILGLFWIIQNIMMLLFAPLLIRRYQSKKNQDTFISIGG